MLDQVLKTIDDGLPASLDRLFALLRIESISTDPAYARRAAAPPPTGWRASLSAIGFDASVRPTPGHPMVVAHDRRGDGDRTSSSTATTTSSRSIRSTCGRRRPSSRASSTRRTGRRSSSRPRRRRRQGSAHDLRRGLPRLDRRSTGELPVKVSMLLEGEEESGSPSLVPVPRRQTAEELHADVALVCDTGMWGRETPGDHRRCCAASSARRSSSPPPAATSIPACTAAPRATRSTCLPTSSPRSTTRTAA